MRTIATYNTGFGKHANFEIKLVTNAKDNNSGEYIVVDPQGNSHESGIWERMKDKNHYIYCGWSYNQLAKGEKKHRYYSREGLMYNFVHRFIKENGYS